MELINISESTVQDLKEVLRQQNIEGNTLRIDANAGWGGVSFYLVLDEPAERDQVEDIDGLKFIVSDNLVNTYKGFSLDSVKYEDRTMFRIKPHQEDEGGGCSSCPSCG